MSSITVTILSGRGLAAMDKNGLSDPYVVLKLMDKKAKKKKKERTKVQSETLTPSWHESFVFKIDATVAELKLECWDKDMLVDEFMGKITLPVDQLLSASGADTWYPLHAKSGSKKSASGEILVRIEQGTVAPSLSSSGAGSDGTAPADSAEKKTPRKKFLSLSRSTKIEHEHHDTQTAAAVAPVATTSTDAASTDHSDSTTPQAGHKAALKLALLAAALGDAPDDDHTTTTTTTAPASTSTPALASSATSAAPLHGSARELPVEHTSVGTSSGSNHSLGSSSTPKLSTLSDANAAADATVAASALAAAATTAAPATPSLEERGPHSIDASPAGASLSQSGGSSSSSRSLAQAKNPLADSEEEELVVHEYSPASTGSPSMGGSQEPGIRHSLSISDHLRDSSSSGDGFMIKITAVSGRDLVSKDSNGLSDPYLEITTESAKKTLRKAKTKVIDKTLNPSWNEVLELPIDKDCQQLRVECWDMDLIGRNFMGTFTLSMDQIMSADGSEHWYLLGQREAKKTERVSGEICLRIQYSAGTVTEKKKSSNLFTSAVKGVVSTAGDAAQFGIDGVARGAKSTLGAAEGVAKGAVSTVGAGGKLVTGAATKGVKLTLNTAEGVAKGAVSTAAGVGGLAVAGVGGIAGGIGGIAAAGVGGMRSLTHSNSKKRITRVIHAGKKTKAIVLPVKVYKGGPPGAAWTEIKTFALTLRPHEKQVLLVWVAIALSYTVLGWLFNFAWDYVFA